MGAGGSSWRLQAGVALAPFVSGDNDEGETTNFPLKVMVFFSVVVVAFADVLAAINVLVVVVVSVVVGCRSCHATRMT